MNQRRALWHKVGYAAAIVVLLLPLSYLSQPQTTDSQGVRSPGGKLAQLRNEYQLSQADLGEIDPTSEAIKLATLGMRGVAANIMWSKANEYKKTENWTAFSAALEQIIRLQPNFIAVWRFQAWNLSYNISVEFDDFRDRFYWVMKGIEFIIGGTKYNAAEPRLLYDIGWFISQKIGRADEHKQYRKLFKEDDDFFNAHADVLGNVSPTERDNWLVGRRWYLKAQELVDTLGVPIKGTSPLVFHSYPSMGLINYAEALEDDGTYGEVAKNAWRKAREGWQEFGAREIPTTYNINIHLNDRERYQKKEADSSAELDKLVPGAREAIRAENVAALDPADRAILEKPEAERSARDSFQASTLERRIRPEYTAIAARASSENRLEALRLAETAAAADNIAGIIDRYRDVVNFDFWRSRSEMEQTADALAGRKLFHEADLLYRDASLEPAAEKYEEGFAKWRAVLDAFPRFTQETVFIEDLNDVIGHYREVLSQLDRKFPDDFLLKDILKAKPESSPQRVDESLDVPADPTQPTSRGKSTLPPSADAPSTPVGSKDAGPKDTGPKDTGSKETGSKETGPSKDKEPPTGSTEEAVGGAASAKAGAGEKSADSQPAAPAPGKPAADQEPTEESAK